VKAERLVSACLTYSNTAYWRVYTPQTTVDVDYCWPGRLNAFDSKGNYSTTSNNTKLVHWPLTGGLLHMVQRGGAWVGCGPAQSPPHCTKCNSPPINGQCTNHRIACYMMVRFSAVLMWRLKVNSQICDACQRQSVVRPLSVSCHISKTKQDSPIVTMVHYI